MAIDWHKKSSGERTFGQRVADIVANGMGSWTFIIVQSVIVALWIAANFIAWRFQWDVYPFILLNLVFSTQAAYAAPIIMMSQNRSAERDLHHAAEDYKTNVDAKKEIEDLMVRLDKMDLEKLDKIISLLEKTSPAAKK